MLFSDNRVVGRAAGRAAGDAASEPASGGVGRLASNLAADLADGLTELVWPTRCVACDMPSELLCADCRAHMPWIAQCWACPVCGAPFGWLTCTECKRDWEVRATVSALTFRGTAARMTTCLKDDHELRLAPVIAAAMATVLDEASAWPALDGAPRFSRQQTDVVSFVPATAAAYARRGFDHMELVARPLARELGLPVADVLARAKALDQRALGREERASNLSGKVRVIEDVSGLGVLLVDDVVTTGASIRECARTLLAAGAREVVACSLARVW